MAKELKIKTSDAEQEYIYKYICILFSVWHAKVSMTFFDHFQWYNQQERFHTLPAFVSSLIVPILVMYLCYNSTHMYNIHII